MLIRIRSSRAPYRRGGLKFSEAKAWQEVEPLGLTLLQILELTADPVLAIEGRPDAQSDWERMPDDVRAVARDFLAKHGAEIGPELASKTGEEAHEALRSLLNSEGPTGAPALADGTQSLGASGEAKGAPSDEAAAGKPAASDAPPAETRKAKPSK